MSTGKLAAAALLLACQWIAAAWVQAADFTWRGQLVDGGEPANGSYDLSVALYPDEAAIVALSGPIQFDAVTVNDGEFAVILSMDEAIDLDQVWLEVSVRDAGDPGHYEALAKREVVDLQPAGACPAAWLTTGNASTGPGNFLGSTNEVALELRAGNRRAVRVVPNNDQASYGDAPNVVLGSSANKIEGTGVEGATISGGGSTLNGNGAACPLCGNSISGDFASIGGGIANSAAGIVSRIGGGESNVAQGYGVAVGGGVGNQAVGSWSTVPGGKDNAAGGTSSFAAGRGALVRNSALTGDADGDEGTFIWSDATTPFGSNFTSSGPNQFLINANGGFALNSTPINDEVEMSIRARANGSNYANLFLRQRDNDAGVLVSVGEATGSANNAALYLDQYDGSLQTRRLTLAANGDLTVTASAFKPGGGSWSSSSDLRLKRGVTPLERPLDRLLGLRGVSFEYADPDPGRRPAGRLMGFVAQQVQTLFPHWIGQDADGYLTVGTQGFEALTVEAMRELRGEKDREIASLRAEKDAEIAALQAQLDLVNSQQQQLAARLDALGVSAETPAHDRIVSAGSH